jgi:hypothetical protein
MPERAPDLKQDESWLPPANIFFCSIIREWEHSVLIGVGWPGTAEIPE